MKNIFKSGDSKQMKFVVSKNDLPIFPGGVVHEVYSTFALARDAEWTTRQFVLEMKDDDEEGIGTMINIVHLGPAFIGEEIIISAYITSIRNHEIICRFEATAYGRNIAAGETGQKILKKEKFERYFSSFKKQ